MSIIPEWMISLLQSMHIIGMDWMDDGTIRVIRWDAPPRSITTARVHDASEWPVDGTIPQRLMMPASFGRDGGLSFIPKGYGTRHIPYA